MLVAKLYPYYYEKEYAISLLKIALKYFDEISLQSLQMPHHYHNHNNSAGIMLVHICQASGTAA